jgi:hypothetical protein
LVKNKFDFTDKKQHTHIMRLFIIAALAVFLYFEFKREKSVVIEYYYDGPYQEEIANGLNYWTTNRLSFKKVDSIDNAYLIIEHADSSRIKKSDWVAQYSPRTKTILLNKNYDHVLKGDYLSGAIAHETGHMFGLKHNTEEGSIMNDKILSSTQPTMLDKLRVNDKISYLYYKRLVENFLIADGNVNN